MKGLPLVRSGIRCKTAIPRTKAPASGRWVSSTSGVTSRKWSTPLAKNLGEAITTTGPISVATYMRQCLTSPDGGYYTRQTEGRDQFGKKGDFITSPEISQIFGELVGLWVVAEWIAQGRKSAGVELIEYGPGRGTLMDDMLRTISSFKSFADSINAIYLVEASSHLREAQRKLLCGDTPFQKNDRGVESRSKYPNKHRIVWVEDSIDVPTTADGQSPFIIAHEFFDALPIHVFQSTPSETQSSGLITSTTPTRTSSRTSKGNKWRELLVTPTSPFSSASPPGSKPAGSSAPEFELVLSNHSTAVDQLLTSLSPRYSALLPTTGAVVEISPESLSLVAEMAKRIGADQKPKQAPSGAALIIDYGPRNTIPTNSLRGIRDHTLVSPFHSPGLVDLSASVDFTGLAEYALEASPRIECHGPVPQAWFLRAMGIVQRAEMLVKKAGGDEDAVRRIEGAWKRLVDVGPRGMGELYQVLGIVPLGRSEEVGGVVGFGGDVKG